MDDRCFIDVSVSAHVPTAARRRLDTYDKAGNGGDAGGMSPEQLSWLRSDLAAHKDQPTVVFGHHPLVVTDSPFPITAGNSLDQTQAASLLDTYARTPSVFLHHAGAHPPQPPYGQPGRARRDTARRSPGRQHGC